MSRICVCGRQAYSMDGGLTYRWDMWEVRHPPDWRRGYYCPPCDRAMELESIRLGFGSYQPTAQDIWDDASNDSEERRRLDALMDRKKVARDDHDGR